MSNSRFGLRTRSGLISGLLENTKQIFLDPDAFAFLSATNLLEDPIIEPAIDSLVLDLKTAGIWTKMKAIYPFVGGTATTHKYNLKDPQDTNAAFRLSFSGGWTHSANGALPNGTNAFANTFFQPSTNLSNYSVSLGYYSRTNNAANTTVDIGSLSAGNFMHMHLRYTGDIWYALLQQTIVDQVANSDSSGFFVGNRNSDSQKKHFRNGANLGTITTLVSATLSTQNIYLGALNNSGSASNFSSKQTAFASIGDGLTDPEASAFYTAVQTFQTALSRQV